METIERSLAEEGPLTRKQLSERLDAAGVPTAGQALHPPAVPRRPARARRARADGRQAARLRPRPRLARSRSRWTARRRWPSWPAATWSATRPPTTATSPAGPGCRCATPAPGWRRSPRSCVERDDGLRRPRKRQPPPAEIPPPRLLGAFDPLLLGWTSREEVVGPHKLLVTINGIFRPFALVDGRAVATWGYAGGEVKIEHLGKVTKKATAALEVDAAEVIRFLNP